VYSAVIVSEPPLALRLADRYDELNELAPPVSDVMSPSD